MKKIYIVTSGEYSDYNIEGVFDDKDLADLYINSFGGEIEKYKINPYKKKLTKDYKSFQVHMNIDGCTEKYGVCIGNGNSNDNWFDNNYENNEVHLIANMWAKDEEHAIKIANERRLLFKANNKWGNLLK